MFRVSLQAFATAVRVHDVCSMLCIPRAQVSQHHCFFAGVVLLHACLLLSSRYYHATCLSAPLIERTVWVHVAAKQHKDMEFSQYRKRYVALEIAYVGTNFHGFARQENSNNTIEVGDVNANTM